MRKRVCFIEPPGSSRRPRNCKALDAPAGMEYGGRCYSGLYISPVLVGGACLRNTGGPAHPQRDRPRRWFKWYRCMPASDGRRKRWYLASTEGVSAGHSPARDLAIFQGCVHGAHDNSRVYDDKIMNSAMVGGHVSAHFLPSCVLTSGADEGGDAAEAGSDGNPTKRVPESFWDDTAAAPRKGGPLRLRQAHEPGPFDFMFAAEEESSSDDDDETDGHLQYDASSAGQADKRRANGSRSVN